MPRHLILSLILITIFIILTGKNPPRLVFIIIKAENWKRSPNNRCSISNQKTWNKLLRYMLCYIRILNWLLYKAMQVPEKPCLHLPELWRNENFIARYM